MEWFWTDWTQCWKGYGTLLGNGRGASRYAPTWRVSDAFPGGARGLGNVTRVQRSSAPASAPTNRDCEEGTDVVGGRKKAVAAVGTGCRQCGGGVAARAREENEGLRRMAPICLANPPWSHCAKQFAWDGSPPILISHGTGLAYHKWRTHSEQPAAFQLL